MFARANSVPVSHASIDARLRFIRRTYAHLLGAMVAFIAIVFALFQMPFVMDLSMLMLNHWYLVFFLWIGTSWVANSWAHRSTSPAGQYLALALFVVAESFLFVPILMMATLYSSAEVIPLAAMTTLVVFAGLTVFVFMTKKDFSFLGSFLILGTILAFGAILGGMFFGFGLGLFFAVAMVGLAGGYILYSTSNVLLHYHTDQHVAAALTLFASVAMLFWYILQIFMGRD
jgi:FtsH-binding integral membrane protein